MIEMVKLICIHVHPMYFPVWLIGFISDYQLRLTSM